MSLSHSKMDNKRIFYLIMTFLVAIEIFLFSNVPSQVGIDAKLNLAAMYHFGIFFMFTFFLSLTLKKNKIDKKTVLIILSISLIYAMFDEFHQLFVPGRFSDIRDILVDLCGSVLSVVMIKIIERFNKL
jgi:VanZ family protein